MSTARPRTDWPIVDIHAHNSCARASSVDELIDAGRDYGVRRFVLLGDVSAYGFYPEPEQVRIINDETIRQVRRFPGILWGFCHLNPQHPPEFQRAELDRCVRGAGLKGIKLEICVNARDSRLDPIMRAAAELRIPVLHHSWYKTVQKYEDESDPSDIAHLARRFPEVTIVMAHLTGGGFRGVQDIKPCPNVIVDTSGSQPVAGMVEYAVAELGADRVVYGSDVPGRDYSAQLGRIWGARIRESERRKILCGNTERLLGL